MPFPNAEHAVIAEEKIRGYLLNPGHLVGVKSPGWFKKKEVSGAFGCPGHRPALVMSVWIVEENDRPRLVTAYPG